MTNTIKSNLCAFFAKLFAATYSGLVVWYISAPVIVWLAWGILQVSVFLCEFYRVKAIKNKEDKPISLSKEEVLSIFEASLMSDYEKKITTNAVNTLFNMK